MAVFGNRSRGGHSSSGAHTSSRSSRGAQQQGQQQGQQGQARAARQQGRRAAGRNARQLDQQASLRAQGAPEVLPIEDIGVATEATGSYADLAGRADNTNKLGAVVISLRNVTKVYPAQPNKPALAGLTLDIRAGEFLFLVGHSGSGKSTFIRMLNREVIPTSGELMVAGENLRTIKNWRIPYLRRNVGCVFQDFKLLPNKTAFENVAFALEVIGKSRHVVKTQVPEVLRLVGLEEKMNKLPSQLSGGEQQRVSIARSIVNRPPILICDEPTGNLDPQTSLGIMRLLERINRSGTTVLVATHDREMVDQMRRRVLALENGMLVRDQKKGVYGYDV